MRPVGSLRLGDHLKRLREERKLTLGGVETLSAGVGERINKSYLFRVERGKTLPTLSRLQVLSQVYRVKLVALVEALETSFEEQRHEAAPGFDLTGVGFEELRQRGIDAVKSGEFSRAALIFRSALERAHSEESSPERAVHLATARHDLSIALRNAGRLDLAREEAEAALELANTESPLADKIRLNLAAVYRKSNRAALAREVLAGLLARPDEVPKGVLAAAHHEMGAILVRVNAKQAAGHYRSALKIERQLRNRFEECKLLLGLGIAESSGGNFNRAVKTLMLGREMAQRYEFSYWHSMIQTELAKTLYLMGDRNGAHSALLEANVAARRGDYYYQLFMNHYYQRRIASDAGDDAAAKRLESSLRFFATRVQGPFDELEAWKAERL